MTPSRRIAGVFIHPCHGNPDVPSGQHPSGGCGHTFLNGKCFLSFMAVLAAVMLLLPTRTEGQSVEVGDIMISVDPRIELMSTVCRLAEYDEYTMKLFKRYDDAVGEYFKPFTSHEVVTIARELRDSSDIGFNAPMGLAVYLKDIESCETTVPFTRCPDDLDKRWNPANVRKFLSSLKAFAAETRFMDFYRTHSAMYRAAVERFRDVMAKNRVTSWFDAFFGSRPGNAFHLILGLQNGGANYAARTTSVDSTTVLYSIIGCSRQDEGGLPAYDDNIVGIVVHEFCHSYTNPIVDRHADLLKAGAEKIFPHVERQMTQSAYPDWKVMMCESFVRACVLRYLETQAGAGALKDRLDRDEKGGFVWIGKLAELLKKYEKNRKDYPGFDNFVPRIAGFFERYIDELDRDLAAVKQKEKDKWEQYKKKGPQILGMTPSNNAREVDPALKELRITFDRRMRHDTFAVMLAPGEEEHFPGTGNVHYDSTQTVFVMELKLKPDWEYTFGLNSFNALGFMDTSGVPLYPVVVKFKTRE